MALKMKINKPKAGELRVRRVSVRKEDSYYITATSGG
jgi:hypothetical protein